MEDNRLAKNILLWDKKFSRDHNVPTWSKEVSSIFEDFQMQYFSENLELFPLKETINSLKLQMKIKQSTNLKLKCQKMPKLRTYIKFKDFFNTPTFLNKPLSFIQRKYLNKFCLSCLEIKIETGRYLHLPENLRLCEVDDQCHGQALQESECHFLLHCPAYNEIRQVWLSRLELPVNYRLLLDEDKLSVLINNTNNVKLTAQFIIDAYNMRTRILFSKLK